MLGAFLALSRKVTAVFTPAYLSLRLELGSILHAYILL